MNELNPLKNELKQFKNKLNESEKEKVQLTEKHKLEIIHQAKDLLQEKSILKKVRVFIKYFTELMTKIYSCSFLLTNQMVITLFFANPAMMGKIFFSNFDGIRSKHCLYFK